MSVVEYQINGITGKNLSAATATLLLVASGNLSYADEIFTDTDFPSAFVKTSEPLDFDLELNRINEYATLESPTPIDEIDEEIIINLKMTPIRSYKRKVKIVKRVQATPRIDIPELV